MTFPFKTATALALVLAVTGSTGAVGQYAPVPGRASVAPATGQRESVTLTRGQAFSVDFPHDMIITNAVDPTVADVDMITPRHAVVRGVGFGQTNIKFFDARGTYMTLDVRVEPDVTSLQENFSRVFGPDAGIVPIAIADNIVLQGRARNASQADQAVRLAGIFAGSRDRVQNMLIVEGNDQVTLKVQVVEVNRTVIKQLGFDTNAIFGQLGMDQYSIGNSPGYAVNGGFQGGFSGGFNRNTTRQPMIERQVRVPIQVYDPATGTFRPDFQDQTVTFVDRDTLVATPQDSAGSTGTNQARALIQAFERQGLARTLAEPNVTAISGETGRFLAGGEFPVPAGRDQSGNITIDFKPYGVGLAFTPTVLSSGRIVIKVETEVSELSNEGAITLLDQSGGGTNTIIQGLSVSRAESVVELSSGGSMMMAGLIMETTRQNIDKVPGLADLPVLGALARSRDYLSNESEIVILVTAYLTNPVSPDRLQTPADGLHIATDMETILLGRLNHVYRRPGAESPPLSYEGPFGHVID